ncbi:MAG: DUF262 domain-containing protein [Actinobacteria bacterium]|nr:DUF262 domain-containing protein [Actinomycetota bacterium]
MDTKVRTPQEIFTMPQRLLVPLFQRPYVWNEELQWEPLWRDLQNVATRYLENPNSVQQPHFLGAVVFQQLQNPIGDLQQRTVIDGQQRLTTLQIMFDAIHAELVAVGAESPAARIEPLVENGKPFWKDSNPEDRFKVWPTNKDRPAFNEVMGAEHPINYGAMENSDSKLVQAHKFFAKKTEAWLAEAGPDQVMTRAAALEKSAREFLQIVVIDLGAQENAQEIFETLNARGAVLTAADLIKNFIFQRLLEQGTDVEKAYDKHWKMFESSFWEQEVSYGRVKYQRSSLFINHWLVAKTGEDVLAREVFSRFKSYADFESKKTMLELLEQICTSAGVYASIYELGDEREKDLDRTALFAYRLKVLELDVVRPLFLYLVDPDEGQISPAELEKCFEIIESWLVRRMLVRVTGKRYNKLIPEVITEVRKDRINASKVLEGYFKNQQVDSAYWPDDEEVRREVQNLEFYRKIYRSRVRMVFEALEDYARGWKEGKSSNSGMRIRRASYSIEHLMPQSWQSNWPLTSGVTDLERDRLVQSLGNLTLLSTKLNSSVSNGPWMGESGKSAALTEHDVLLLNKRVQDSGKNGWSEELIRARTEELTSMILDIWKVPEGHISKVNRAKEENSQKINVIDLISAGLVQPGQTLYPKMNRYKGRNAQILVDGRIDIEGSIYDSLSLAGSHIRKKNTNGWTFWLVQESPRERMFDLRDRYKEMVGAESSEDLSDDDSEDEE